MKFKPKASSGRGYALGIWLLVAGVFVVIFIGDVDRRFPVFLPGVVTICVITFFLILLQDDWDPKHKIMWLRALCLTSVVITIFMGFGGYSRHKVGVEKCFLSGVVKKEDYTYDTGEGEGNGTAYWVETKDQTEREVLDWLYCLVTVVGPAATAYIFYKKFATEKDFS